MVRRTRQWLTALGLFVLYSHVSAAEGRDPDPYVEFKINAPTMAAALIQFTQQTGLQLMYPRDGATQAPAPKLEGSFTARAALEQLLRDSGLTFEFVNAHTVLVRARVRVPNPRHDTYTSPAAERQEKSSNSLKSGP